MCIFVLGQFWAVFFKCTLTLSRYVLDFTATSSPSYTEHMWFTFEVHICFIDEYLNWTSQSGMEQANLEIKFSAFLSAMIDKNWHATWFQ